jgi:hypothetical protein
MTYQLLAVSALALPRERQPIHFEYLLATTQAQVTWLQQFAEPLRSGRRQWRQAG